MTPTGSFLWTDREVRRALGMAGLDLPDEQRNVDAGRTGRHTGRVIAEITAIRRHDRFVTGQGWMQIVKVVGNCIRA